MKIADEIVKEHKKEYQDIENIIEMLPLKPYATNNYDYGVKIFSRKKALTKKYIQLNPPYVQSFFTLDLDYSTWPLVCEDLELPNPLYFVQNKKNGHAHLIFGIFPPVLYSPKAKTRPQQYLEDIIKAYQRKLKADPCYIGLISKNPLSDFWRVVKLSNRLHSLEFYRKWVEAELAIKKPDKLTFNEIDYSVLGRNCNIFVQVKKWAYKEIKSYWDKNYSDWFEAVYYQCQVENSKFDSRLDCREIKTIARSISKWTWENFTAENFSRIQTARINLRWSKQSKKFQGIEMLKNGASVAEVMQSLDVSRATAFNWKAEIPKIETDKIIQC